VRGAGLQQRFASGEEEGVLDLRARDPSVISVGSQHSGASEPAGYLDAVRSVPSRHLKETKQNHLFSDTKCYIKDKSTNNLL
jgi:hypothetical protein